MADETFKPTDKVMTMRSSNSFVSTKRLISPRRGFSITLLVAASLLATPALSGEVASTAWLGHAGQGPIFDAGVMAATDGLSSQLGGGSWGQAIDELYTPDQLALEGERQLTQQGTETEVGDAGGVLTNANEISRQSNNPLGGDFILWLNFINIDQQQGEITDTNRYNYSHLLQPVIPIKLPQIGENWILVNRPTFPTTIKQEVSQGPHPQKGEIHEFDDKSGFGDIEYLAMLGTSTPTYSGWLAESFGVGDAVLAAGFTTRFPTGKDSLSRNVYAAGPAVTGGYMGKDYTFATLVQHWWDYSKQNNAENFNFTRAQLFYYKSFPGGWLVGGSPKITADWSESNDDRWTVPIGLGVVKTVFLGDLPIRLGVELRRSIVRPDDLGTDWQLEFSIIPVTRNFVADWFK